MQTQYNVLILGASYGSLLATKLLLGGHNAKLVCLPAEVELIDRKGVVVRMPVKASRVSSKCARASCRARSRRTGRPMDPAALVVLACRSRRPRGRRSQLLGRGPPARRANLMICRRRHSAEPGCFRRSVPELLHGSCRMGRFRTGLDDALQSRRAGVPSPDEQVNVLQVSPSTNFKAARFESEDDTAMLRQIAADIDAARFATPEGSVDLPVKLRVHDSVFVPLAKWAMLLAGNYRCVQQDGMRSISEAVHADLAETRAVYDWVVDLCMALGADRGDLVPFDKYAAAARSLAKPSAARALANGAACIERTDRLVQAIGAQGCG